MGRADTVAVAVCSETGMVAAAANRFAKRPHVRFDRFRIDAAEKRIPRAAYLVTGYAVPPHQRKQEPAGRSVHRIDNEAKPGRSEFFPIDQFVDGIEIGGEDVERVNTIG